LGLSRLHEIVARLMKKSLQTGTDAVVAKS
jgi:hypothetical protein